MRRQFLIPFFISSIILASCTMLSSSPKYDFNQVSTFAAQTVAASSGTQMEQTPKPETATTFESPNATALVVTNSTPSDPSCNLASFVLDVTVPDDTPFFVNKPFTKIWRLKNVGTCTWTPAYQLVFDSGYRMSGTLAQPLTNSSVAPGDTVEISVDLIAPSLAGTYRSNWKIQTPSGETFALSSGPFWVQIKARRGSIVVWQTLKQGDSKLEVYVVQYLLNYHGLSTIVDGVFGADMRKNVKTFQNRKGVDEDGFVGPETWEIIVVKVSRGSNNEAVRAAQYLLKNKFGYDLEVDGIFGPITEKTVKEFQSKQGLTNDGVVDPLTWQKLIGK